MQPVAIETFGALDTTVLRGAPYTNISKEASYIKLLDIREGYPGFIAFRLKCPPNRP